MGKIKALQAQWSSCPANVVRIRSFAFKLGIVYLESVVHAIHRHYKPPSLFYWTLRMVFVPIDQRVAMVLSHRISFLG